MAFITLNTDKLKQNYQYLDTFFKRQGIQWGVVLKLLCGNELYLRSVLDLGPTQVCDSRIANLRMIKSLAPHIETIFIKPPAKRNAAKVVEYADISCNTSIGTIKALSAAAVHAGKTHKIIIMLEAGELREGVLSRQLLQFYGDAIKLPNIEIIGLGTNLTCMNGVLPSYENLKTLEICKELIEENYGTEIAVLSGGASVTIPLAMDNTLPEQVNHFRVGETLFFGTDVYSNDVFDEMHQHLFTLHAEIIELATKPNIPNGKIGHNLLGIKLPSQPLETPVSSVRAIVDMGLLDVDINHLEPVNKQMKFAGASSDMIVVDLGRNPAGYRVGDKISFHMDYMGVLRVMNSKYIEKRIERYDHATVAPKGYALAEPVTI